MACLRRETPGPEPRVSPNASGARESRGSGPARRLAARSDLGIAIIELGVSVQQPPAPLNPGSFSRLHRFVLVGALVVGVGIGAAIALLRSSSTSPAVTSSAASGPPITWPVGKKVAPGFTLRSESGSPISLKQFRGRPVILTFIDPLCRNLCPLEAKTLGRVASSFPAARRPAIVAVSVNLWADARKNLLLDKTKWGLPGDWQWAVGAPAALARVWKNYSIGVSVATHTIAGIKVRRITHTEAAYLIDPTGHERALYLYPFLPQDVERTLRSLDRA